MKPTRDLLSKIQQIVKQSKVSEKQLQQSAVNLRKKLEAIPKSAILSHSGKRV